MATKKDEAIVPVSNYAIMQRNLDDIMEAITTNLDGEQLGPRDLTRITVPTGGAKYWTIPSLRGDEIKPAITGIIINTCINRALFEGAFGQGATKPPVCSSCDGRHGVGNPGGDCISCPYAQFGTKVDQSGNLTNGQACKQMRLVFIMVPNKLLPIVAIAPPTSLANVKNYLVELTNEGIPYTSAMTSLSLESDKSAGGIEYSKVVPTFVEELTPDQTASVKILAAKINGLINNTSFIVEPMPAGDSDGEVDDSQGGGPVGNETPLE